MEINLVIPLDQKGQKKIDQYRFQYDRKLLKICEPAVEFMPPIETFMNLRYFQKEIPPLLHGINRFKLQFSKVGTDIPGQSLIYFSIEKSNSLISVMRKLMKVSVLKEFIDEEYIPRVLIYREEDIETAEDIYQSLQEEDLNYHFFASQINLIMRDKNEYWQIIEEYPI